MNQPSSVSTAPLRQAGLREGLVLMLGSSLTIMGSVMVSPVLPRLGAEFGPVEPRADLLLPLAVTGPALAIALCAPLAGWLADRVGRKALLVLATLLYAVLGALPAMLDSLPAIVATRLLFGCTEAAVMTCCATLIADYWHDEERLRYVNRQVVTIGLVGALFFVVGGALGEHSWRSPFLLYLLPLLLVPSMMKVLWEPPLARRSATRSPNDGAGLTKVAVLPLVVGNLMIFGGMVLAFVLPVQAPMLLVSLGITSSTMIGMAAGLSLLATLVGSLMWPMLRRRFGIAGCNALLLGLASLGLWLLTRAQSYNEVLVSVLIQGLGFGLLVPNVMAPVMNALTASTRGRGLGGFTAFLYLGQFASPLVVAGVGGLAGDLRQSIQWLAFTSLVVALLWLITGLRSRGHDQASPIGTRPSS
ncbi:MULTISPECIES: MFS transporter [unclassified Pseudomonas]|uniref:MFS transporter n=1 Tax=unclassified Pseudomonas TaxID=196821 RepID=UPI00119A2AB5|nr:MULTISPECIES: MFS transporter [unclassified Pseudomonas]TWC15498.1 putative MFS family arabinose efflux permease [Pseudomonas sp. SJZ075]TWC19082.1 putative MFS family arabinose efflux permease [Pseudomonas sp. SJZ074]TWC30452.1 putative MFS family arabinose efflux permease [Pseudomonas sp. SJZ078]TWC36902.1 putative MFS family arabinose efflux permease [Pseudomonas sp. SJZ085]TWC53147.1 putative MFS family arabinose efflux permease [Pseudomonas sp. SJZ124]